MEHPEPLYFKNADEWREWLHENHASSKGIHLIFYKVSSISESMRWEEAVQVALCYGWIDSTVRKIDEDCRKQFFSPRKDKSVWSKLNKTYIEKLIENDLMHQSGLAKIAVAKQNGSWNSLDAVEELLLPEDLQLAFEANKIAFDNYLNFSKTYRKSYLYWLNQAKRMDTRNNRIAEIIALCAQNKKARD
ncbi:YdeI/OmpD-associated family protein [Flavobacterium sp. Fl-77]|uniref:YdeI/OmpD-associated family protein n=1 Tax=Flavobacterium flavipigmentatum TaxID=2893884 RepID=A0AAJ2VZG5_9FLAO|nr:MULTISPECIES: YdeI/OmpD-associated family protein [unclassified Flavobacterium]MDX6184007.1 YdeI/OmpD-associated family protein [Flavobacterium sp. Fl-33]MDX6187560.1 YdeI/OmpD-associated family protein [Flavobacterium sp. Fl-77]UFH38453.1 YdeI/OmpD-associated family protein [Flavobacterium sp. F-70]